ncbi:hypothetical protein [Gordonia sp. (in: high G+C Gram-positive bacteria)]|uniref:hypothetical protein n=1 Tax=Gordonia sp. (in: high G+C Gram-positive bacteria) TaxID=84139 RepID=UPI0039E53E8F
MHDVKVGAKYGYQGLGKWLTGPECRRLVSRKASEAAMVYQALVAKRTGRLARSAKHSTVIGGAKGDRWVGRVTVDAPYAASHEFGYTSEQGVRRDGFDELRNTLKHLD